MAIPVKVPALGESVKQATLLKWHKTEGQPVKVDDALCELETDKANVDVPAQVAGVFHQLKHEGDQVLVDEVIAEIDPAAAAPAKAPAPKKEAAKTVSTPAAAPAPAPAAVILEDFSPAVRRLIQENQINPKSVPATGPGGRLTKEDVEKFIADGNGNGSGENAKDDAADNAARQSPPGRSAAPTELATMPPPPKPPKKESVAIPTITKADPAIVYDENGLFRSPMTKFRKRIAQTLVEAQRTAAILTTFNEVDLTSVIELRAKLKERFQEVHGVGLGFMSFFARATVLALREFPRINAFLERDEVVYHRFVHLGIAVSTDRGLAVPVLRNVEKMPFSQIESEIKRLATATREGKLALHELTGGTFTITNGGVFGSLLSTPILTPPQSGILGMHAIQKRPMVVNDKIEIRSMMYLALSYDHRLVDGRESVGFLVRLKQYLEDPARMMLEI